MGTARAAWGAPGVTGGHGEHREGAPRVAGVTPGWRCPKDGGVSGSQRVSWGLSVPKTGECLSQDEPPWDRSDTGDEGAQTSGSVSGSTPGDWGLSEGLGVRCGVFLGTLSPSPTTALGQHSHHALHGAQHSPMDQHRPCWAPARAAGEMGLRGARGSLAPILTLPKSSIPPSPSQS